MEEQRMKEYIGPKIRLEEYMGKIRRIVSSIENAPYHVTGQTVYTTTGGNSSHSNSGGTCASNSRPNKSLEGILKK